MLQTSHLSVFWQNH